MLGIISAGCGQLVKMLITLEPHTWIRITICARQLDYMTTRPPHILGKKKKKRNAAYKPYIVYIWGSFTSLSQTICHSLSADSWVIGPTGCPSYHCHRTKLIEQYTPTVLSILTSGHLGDNCIQIFHLGRYIVGYTVGNLVLRRRASGAVKRDFRTYIRRYTSPNEKFEYGYPDSNALLQFRLK